MKCPCCLGETKVQKTKSLSSRVERRRQCLVCKFTFATSENATLDHLKVVKMHGGQEYFQMKKITDSIERVVHSMDRNRAGGSLSRSEVLDIGDGVQKKLIADGYTVIYSSLIARMVLGELKERSELAWRRYAVDYLNEDGALVFPRPSSRAMKSKKQPDDLQRALMLNALPEE